MMRVKLIHLGSECLEHMLSLARKYSDIGDCDRCMILRSNALLTTTGLLELHRPALDGGVIFTTEEVLESRKKCEELLVLLANIAQQTMEGEGHRIRDFVTVFLSRSSWRLTDHEPSTTTAEIGYCVIPRPSSVLSRPEVLRALSSRSPHILSESSTNVW